jgi:hypothetical protein
MPLTSHLAAEKHINKNGNFIDPWAIMPLEEPGGIKKIQWPHRESNHVLPAYSIQTQPTTLACKGLTAVTMKNAVL